MKYLRTRFPWINVGSSLVQRPVPSSSHLLQTRNSSASHNSTIMDSHIPTAIPEGSLVLITGATSYLASYAIKGLLERGYRVRGIVRNLSRASWLVDEIFPSFAQSGVFDLAEVPDMTVPNAFDGVIINSGASAILHFATPFDFSPNPNDMIPQAVEGVLGLLRAAAQESSIKRLVYTSSVGAVFTPEGGVPATMTKDSWNDAALKVAWSPPPYEPERAVTVYSASKVEAERAMFKFLDEEKPGFTATSVNPFLVIGPVLHERYLKSTAVWIRNVSNGEPGLLAHMCGESDYLYSLNQKPSELTTHISKYAKSMCKMSQYFISQLPWTPMSRTSDCLPGLNHST